MSEQKQDRDAVIERVLEERKDQPGALLPILHGIQDALGYVPREAIARIAQALNLSRAEIHGVVSFYHYLQPDRRDGTWFIFVVRSPARRWEPTSLLSTPRRTWESISTRPHQTARLRWSQFIAWETAPVRPQ